MCVYWAEADRAYVSATGCLSVQSVKGGVVSRLLSFKITIFNAKMTRPDEINRCTDVSEIAVLPWPTCVAANYLIWEMDQMKLML